MTKRARAPVTTAMEFRSLRFNIFINILTSGRSFTGLNLEWVARPPKYAQAKAIHGQINHWCGVKREQFTKQQAAYDCDAERAAQFGPCSGTKGQWERPKHGGHSGHQDGPKTQHAGLEDGFTRIFTFLP